MARSVDMIYISYITTCVFNIFTTSLQQTTMALQFFSDCERIVDDDGGDNTQATIAQSRTYENRYDNNVVAFPIT